MVDKFCFCAKLETGGVFLGILGMIANFILIFGSIIGVSVLYTAHIQQNESKDDKILLTIVTIVAVAVILVSIGHLIASIFLYLGTKQRRPGYVRVWLVASMISIVLGFFQILKALLSGPKDTIIIQIFSFGVSVYWWICINDLNEVFINETESQSQTRLNHPRGEDRKYVHRENA